MIKATRSSRVTKAERLVASGAVSAVSETGAAGVYRVTGDSGRYLVTVIRRGHTTFGFPSGSCTCPAFRTGDTSCSHLIAAASYQRRDDDPFDGIPSA